MYFPNYGVHLYVLLVNIASNYIISIKYFVKLSSGMSAILRASSELKAIFLELSPFLEKGWVWRYLDTFCSGFTPREIVNTYFTLLNISRKGKKASAPSITIIENIKLLIQKNDTTTD